MKIAEFANKELSIFTVLKDEGIEGVNPISYSLRWHEKFDCPFCHGLDNPTFIADRFRNTFYCFRCHRDGYPIDLFIQFKGINKHEAIVGLLLKYPHLLQKEVR